MGENVSMAENPSLNVFAIHNFGLKKPSLDLLENEMIDRQLSPHRDRPLKGIAIFLIHFNIPWTAIDCAVFHVNTLLK